MLECLNASIPECSHTTVILVCESNRFLKRNERNICGLVFWNLPDNATFALSTDPETNWTYFKVVFNRNKITLLESTT